MSAIEVVYALHMKPGDLYAGKIVPDAPTRPVQPFAAAHRLTEVTPYADDEGVKWLRLEAGPLPISPVRTTSKVILIRGTS